jgi:MFS family permease
MVGGMLGQLLFGWTNFGFFFVVGWAFTGLLVGVAIGVYELITNTLREKNLGMGMRLAISALLLGGSLLAGAVGALALAFNSGALVIVATVLLLLAVGGAVALTLLLGQDFGKDLRGARAKLLKCLVGGTVGGVLGGVLALALRIVWAGVFAGKNAEDLWSPTATGFVALGMCIGLLVGLAQVILKEAWIKVEAGFRPGREMILAKEITTIGRAEGCDLGLFGDMECDKMHARIVLAGSQYYVEDAGTPGGTYVNDQRVNGRAPLKTNDLIRVGRSLVRFRERQKRK